MDTLKKIGLVAIGAGVTYQVMNYITGDKMILKEIEVTEEELKRRRLNHIDFESEDYKMIVKEQLVRNYQFFGDEGQEKIKKAHIVILGLDGIGSHLVNTLIRSGVEFITIIDFGVVTKEDLTITGFFFEKDLGKSRIQAVENYLIDICPHGKINLVELAQPFTLSRSSILKSILESPNSHGDKDVDFIVNTVPGLFSQDNKCSDLVDSDFTNLNSLNNNLRILNVSSKLLDPLLTSPSFLTLKPISNYDKPSYTLTTILDSPIDNTKDSQDHVFFPSIPSTVALYLSSLILSNLADHKISPCHPVSITNHHVNKIHKKIKDYLIRQPEMCLKSFAN